MEANIQPRITDETRPLWTLLDQIPDPEVPAISIVELGVIRDVQRNGSQVVIEMTPTYSGCPALKTMEEAVLTELQANGYEVTIRIVYKPAWTTEWLSEAAKAKLKAYGIAPPPRLTTRKFHPLEPDEPSRVSCPFCDSVETKLTSQFGSTACKALYFCDGCRQPFELFKCH
ncbi:MAG: 1,2-phenylacetyl-CoA epoxidase subunit PaaD [Bacteroidota bacterium]